MKKILFILMLFSFGVSHAQALYGVSVTKENSATVTGYTAYINPTDILWIVKKTAPDIWYQDKSLGKAIKYTVSNNADSLYAQLSRLHAPLVKVLKTEKVSTRDTTIQYLITTSPRLLKVFAKTNSLFTPAATAVIVQTGSLSTEFPVVESGAAIKARIDSLKTANP